MPVQTNYITTESEYTDAIQALMPVQKLCLDFETTGLDARIAQPRLLQLCSTDSTDVNRIVYVFDLFAVPADDRLRELIETREMIVGWNLNFDLQFLHQLKIDYKGKIFDGMIAEKTLHAGKKEKRTQPKTGRVYFAEISYSLKATVARRLETEMDKEQQVSDWSAAELEEDQINYAALDVYILATIAKQQLEELAAENLLNIYTLESQIIRAVSLMCHYGFKVDVNKLKAVEAKKQQELDNATRLFCESIDDRLPSGQKLPRRPDGTLAIGKSPSKEFNPGSNQQCIKYFEELGIALPTNIRTGKATLDQVALAEFNSDDESLIALRKRQKCKTSVMHVQKIIDNINPIDLRIHSGYNQYGAASGRFTSSGAKRELKSQPKTCFGINIQQVPRDSDIRSCFIPTPGYKFVRADYSQIELRLGAELIGIQQMIDAYVEGEDLHSLTASLVYDVHISNVTPKMRQMGKGLNFGLLYGMGAKKYRTYSAQSGTVLTVGEAKNAHYRFHNSYPRLKEWHRERADLVRDGWCYVRTPLGRRRLLSYDDCTMSAAANTVIQGAGADILKLAIAKLDKSICEDFRPVATIHDELVFEAKEERVKEYMDILEESMKEAAETVLQIVPVEADPVIAATWAEK